LEVRNVVHAIQECSKNKLEKSVKIVRRDSTVRQTTLIALRALLVRQVSHKTKLGKHLAFHAYLDRIRTKQSRLHARRVYQTRKVVNQIRRRVIHVEKESSQKLAARNVVHAMQECSKIKLVESVVIVVRDSIVKANKRTIAIKEQKLNKVQTRQDVQCVQQAGRLTQVVPSASLAKRVNLAVLLARTAKTVREVSIAQAMTRAK